MCLRISQRPAEPAVCLAPELLEEWRFLPGCFLRRTRDGAVFTNCCTANKCNIIGSVRGYLGMNNLCEGTGSLVLADVKCMLCNCSSTQ